MALATKNLNCNLTTVELDGDWVLQNLSMGILTTFLRYWYMEE